ncbi:hypothetical protein KKI24_14365, partial [bacterium]|nr:hypothetical protein [bacterium]
REICQLNEKPKQVLIDLSILLDQMQLKGKKLTSMIQIIDELKRGYNIPLADLLNDPQLIAIRKDFAAHQRYRHIKARLLSLRFPELSRLQREWDETIKKTGLGSLITIQHDPYFEDDCLQIILSARNPTELKQLLQQLLKKTEAPELEHLFSFV